MAFVKIKEAVKYRKNFIKIDDQVTYKRCRVQLHRRGVKLRDEIKGESIKTKKQRLCKTNDFIVAEMDAKFGGYGIIPSELEGAIVSSHYYLYELDSKKLLSEFLQVIIDSGALRDQIKAVGSTNYSRVSAKEVLEYEIPCPSLYIQSKIVSFYFKSKEQITLLSNQLTHQQILLKKLRQQILQEAIQGKLTADFRVQNPDIEPAGKLLARIKAEKEQLIKEKKIKKQKPLPPISEEEIPFKLPEGWVWCRLGELGFTQTGTTPPTQDKSNYGRHIPFVQPADIKISEKIDYDVKKLSEKGLDKGRLIEAGSVLMVCIGGSIGKSATNIMNVSCNQQINTITPLLNIDSLFIQKILQSPYFHKTVWSRSSGGTTPIVNKTKWETIFVPLPPLPEQKAITTKVEKLLSIYDQLETQITTNQTHTEQLMQAVLKEAFSQSGET